jgi:hypothetical protein
MFDGYLNDIPMEIKAIEGKGVWTISSKLRAAEKQHAECVILYFPDKNLYSEERVFDGIGKYLANPESGKDLHIRLLLAITQKDLIACWDKKATPIEGWSIWEGFRRRNGARPFTISPSDANI